MTSKNLIAAILTIAYFTFAVVGFQRKFLSGMEMKLMVAIGLIGSIVIWINLEVHR